MHRLITMLILPAWIVWCLLVLSFPGCSTKIENQYTINGNSNQIKASDSVSSTPNNKDLIDVAGSATGNNRAGGTQ